MWTPAVYDSLAGKYHYVEYCVLTVTRKGNHLFAQLTGQPKYEIFPKSATEFFWKVVDAQVTFVKDATGTTGEAIHHQDGQKNPMTGCCRPGFHTQELD